MSVAVKRHIVVPISRQPQKLGVFIEAVASAGIGDKRKEVLRAQVIDPGKGRLRNSDHILFPFVIKISVFHTGTSVS